jgi:hypothetical protein
MSAALKHTVRVATLGLLVAGLTGCSTENPMAPSMVATPTAETAVIAVPITPEPIPPGESIVSIIPFEDRSVSLDRQKKPKKDNPGQHRGWE